MIKRYYLDSGMDPCESCVFTEDRDGEWVRWKDVEALLSDAKNEILEKFLRHKRILKALELSYRLRSTSEESNE